MTRKKSVLLVEGRDDKVVCSVLMERHAVPVTFAIEERTGVEAVLRAFPIFLENTAYGRVGLVVDADTDLAARWQSVQRHLLNLGYISVPAEPHPEGTIISAPDEDRPLAGVWIMPDNQTAGILEDFIRSLIPPGDALLAHADTCVDGIPAGHRRFPHVRRSKALIHTWLAWQKEPGFPFGTAITERYLDADGDPARRFVAWCRRLFVDTPPPDASSPA